MAMTSNTNPLALVVDDDRAIRESLERALSIEGYRVITAPDGAMALDLVAEQGPDIVVLDLMMPNVDGLTVCRRMRSKRDRTPILMLTARTETSDRVSGLDAGADDYLPKPFDLDELLARIRALLRRTRSDEDDTALAIDDLVLDTAGRRATRSGTDIELTKTEFDLLELLVRNAGVVLDQSTIYERIWGYDFGPDSKNLAVYIGYLRRKTEAGDAPRLVHTVRGIGYVVRST